MKKRRGGDAGRGQPVGPRLEKHKPAPPHQREEIPQRLVLLPVVPRYALAQGLLGVLLSGAEGVLQRLSHGDVQAGGGGRRTVCWSPRQRVGHGRVGDGRLVGAAADHRRPQPVLFDVALDHAPLLAHLRRRAAAEVGIGGTVGHPLRHQHLVEAVAVVSVSHCLHVAAFWAGHDQAPLPLAEANVRPAPEKAPA